MKKPLLCLTGATATGKTGLSLTIYDYLKKQGVASEIVNFDSLIFYKELNIGTAKPTEAELTSCPHHLVNIQSIAASLNASDYISLAQEVIGRLHQENKVPILVGGSGFYLRALIKGMYDSPTTPQDIKDQVAGMSDYDLRLKLKDCDYESWNTLHENDRYRNARALEHFLTHNTKFSQLKKESDDYGPYDFSTPQDKSWHVINIYLHIEKEAHWTIMEQRAQKMISSGLIEEVQSLLKAGHSPQLSPLESIGYKETIQYLDPDHSAITTRQELAERIYINTRRLAKSQKTFFNKVTPQYKYHSLEEKPCELFRFIMNELKSCGTL